MRVLIILICAWFITFNSYAQKQQSLHVGIHYFEIEDAKFALDFINIGYQKELSKRFIWDTSLGFISYSREEKSIIIRNNDPNIDQSKNFFTDINQTSVLAFNSRIGYSFVKKPKKKIGLAVGLTTVYAIENRYMGGNSFYNPNTGFLSSTSYVTYDKNFDIGWTPKLYYERKINSNFSVEGAAEIYFHLRNMVPYIYALGLRLNYNLAPKKPNKVDLETPKR
jgi:hypothetical protein